GTGNQNVTYVVVDTDGTTYAPVLVNFNTESAATLITVPAGKTIDYIRFTTTGAVTVDLESVQTTGAPVSVDADLNFNFVAIDGDDDEIGGSFSVKVDANTTTLTGTGGADVLAG